MKEKLLPIIVSALLFFPVGYVIGSTQEGGEKEQTANETSATEDHDHPEGTDPDHSHEQDDEASTESMTKMESEDSHDASAHHNKPFDASNLELRPAVTNLQVVADEKSGWNLSFDIENFTFTPEQVNQAHVDNEGHAHLLINGEKLSRLYGTNLHINELPGGENKITVTLNNNMHAEYQIDDETIEASTSITSQ